MLSQDGVKVTFLSVPQFKTEANPFEPLTEAAIAHHMGQVEQTYDTFVEAVARGRHVGPAKVRSSFGEGRTFHSQQAAGMGMIDRVATLPQVLQEMGASGVAMQSASDLQAQESLCAAWLGELSEIMPPVSRPPRRRIIA